MTTQISADDYYRAMGQEPELGGVRKSARPVLDRDGRRFGTNARSQQQRRLSEMVPNRPPGRWAAGAARAARAADIDAEAKRVLHPIGVRRTEANARARAEAETDRTRRQPPVTAGGHFDPDAGPSAYVVQRELDRRTGASTAGSSAAASTVGGALLRLLEPAPAPARLEAVETTARRIPQRVPTGPSPTSVVGFAGPSAGSPVSAGGTIAGSFVGTTAVAAAARNAQAVQAAQAASMREAVSQGLTEQARTNARPERSGEIRMQPWVGIALPREHFKPTSVPPQKSQRAAEVGYAPAGSGTGYPTPPDAPEDAPRTIPFDPFNMRPPLIVFPYRESKQGLDTQRPILESYDGLGDLDPSQAPYFPYAKIIATVAAGVAFGALIKYFGGRQG